MSSTTFSLSIGLFIFYAFVQFRNIASGQLTGTLMPCDVEGERITNPGIPNMKCYECFCKNGSVACEKPKCPNVENCNEIEKDDCCFKCKDVIKYMDPPKGACVYGKKLYRSGSQFSKDDCTKCICSNSEIHCEKVRCPILNCKWEHQLTPPGQCCAECNKIIENDKNEDYYDEDEDQTEQHYQKPFQTPKNVIEKNKKEDKKDCLYNEKLYRNGETWNTTTCETCTCAEKKIDCVSIMCPVFRCPPNTVLKMPERQCECPVCMESQSACTIFGGTHYRTFDGKMFSFLGSCKYELVDDCDSKTFNIRLKTIAIGNNGQIESISLKLGELNVDLQKNKNTKVNDEVIDLPYQLKNKLEITGSKENVIITSRIGVKIQWNYIGVLEITVPKKYRNKLCGLCGNFNSDGNDDFFTREGILVDDPTILAQSWTSEDEDCLETKKYGIRGCDSRKHHRLCNYMKGSVFERCLKKINVTRYHETCLKDMCECPPDDDQCHCESVINYVRDCRRLGITLPRWRKSVGC